MSSRKDSAFQQQRLPAVQSLYSANCSLISLIVIATSSLCIGGALMIASDRVIEVSMVYGTEPCPYEEKDGKGCSVTVTFDIAKKMHPPVFLFYKLTNFHQNHRKYAHSISFSQLNGSMASNSDLNYCEPYARTSRGLVYHPCGAMSWSFFNDTFSLMNNEGVICDGTKFDEQNLPTDVNNGCTKKGIAWESDAEAETKISSELKNVLTYKGVPESEDEYAREGCWENEPNHKIPNPFDEDFLVWVRDEPLTTFRKLYRKIEKTLIPGKYEMHIEERYPVREFGGTKSFILTSPNWLGGKSYTLASFYLIVGCICFVLSVTFALKMYFPKHGFTPIALN